MFSTTKSTKLYYINNVLTNNITTARQMLRFDSDFEIVNNFLMATPLYNTYAEYCPLYISPG